jgi:autoinducer 2 (AI-2) kinase
MMEGIGFYCGIVMRWFRDAFCELEALEAQATGEDLYAIMERKARDLPPGANGVFGIFSNVMRASRWVHASPGFVGFDVGNPGRAGRVECFRAIEESAAYVTRGHLEIVHEVAGIDVSEAVLIGGAAKGGLWPQIVADVLAIPIQIPKVKESTALGAAIYAGVGAGMYSDAGEAASRLVRFERACEPDPGASASYRELYDQWLELYARSLEISEAGLARPLWRAAGT